MAVQTQLRRGTTAENLLFTGAVGELTVDTDIKELRLQDGSRAGGHAIPNFTGIQTRLYNYNVSGGSATAWTLSTQMDPIALTAGLRCSIKVTTSNTSGAFTLAWGGLAATAVKKWSSGSKVDLAVSELTVGRVYDFDYDGTHWVIASSAGGGKDVLLDTTFAAVANVNFQSLITAAYNRYEWEIIDLTASSSGAGLYTRTSTNNGSSYDSGGSDYTVSGMAAASGSSVVGSLAAATTASPAIVATGLNNGSSYSLNGTVKLSNPLNTNRYKTLDFATRYYASTNELLTAQGTVQRNAIADVDALQFFMSAGTMSGRIIMYGLN